MRLRRVLMLLRRRLYAACAAATLVTPIALALPAPVGVSAVNPTPALSIVSTSTWTETGRVPALHVVGEVRNDDGVLTAASIQVDCRLVDVTETITYAEQSNSAAVAILKPGERSPFEVVFQTPPSYDHPKCTVSSVSTPQVPDHDFSFSGIAVAPDGSGNVLSGNVNNLESISVRGAIVYLTVYRNNTDNPPQTIAEDQYAVNPDGSAMAPGAVAFSIPHYAPPSWNGQAYALIAEAPAPVVALSQPGVSLTQVKTRSIDGPQVTLTNLGTADLHVGALTITGLHAAEWSEVDTCQGQTILPLGTCTITATFTPSDVGDRSAVLSIADDANHNPHTLTLTGTGTNPAVSFSPSPFALGTQVLGSTGPGQNLTVSNPGIGDLHVTSAALSGPNAGDFAITSDGCSGHTVPQTTSCTITAKFTPGALGGRSASLTLTDDALTSPQSVSVTGTGVTSSVAFDSPTRQYTFGNQQVGLASAALTVTVTNGGASTLHVSSACLSNTAEFAYSVANTFCASGFSLAPGTNKQIPVKMTPAATGVRTTNLTLIDDAPDSPQTATLSGNGTFGGQYHPIAPTRVLDTRGINGVPLGAPIAPLGPGLSGAPALTFQVTGAAGVPAQATAVIVNATVTDTTGAGSSFLTLYPANVNRPNASNLNWVQGKTVANLVEVGLSPDGKIKIFNALGQADVILDVAGYVLPEASPPTTDGFYNPVVPARLLDTRGVNGTPVGAPIAPVGPGVNHEVDLQITGAGPVPASGVAAVVLNVTVTNPTAHDSFVSVFPTGGQLPNVSNVNFVAGQTVPNRVVVKVGAGGKVTFYNPVGTVDVIADVGGWFTDGTAGGTGAGFNPLSPTRILDTRGINGVPVGAPIAPLGQTPLKLTIAGVKDSNGTTIVPAMNSATPPQAVVLNVTVTNTVTDSGGSFLTVWPDGVTQPGVSDLNFGAGMTVPNLVVVKVGADGKIAIANAKGTADVVVDIVGWYS